MRAHNGRRLDAKLTDNGVYPKPIPVSQSTRERESESGHIVVVVAMSKASNGTS